MVGMCCRYVGDRAVAEDLAHEAFLKAIEKSGSYHRLGSFDGWLMRINLNTTLDYLRRQPTFLSMDDGVETCHGASLHGLIKFGRNGFYGLKDAHGNVVVYPKYTDIQPFDEYRTGWAMVEIFGFKGFVDNSGKEVVAPQYDDIGKFGRYRDGCALVQKGKFYGLIDTTGKEVVPVTHKMSELIDFQQ